MLATNLPVAQWLERPTGVRKVMGSIPVGDSDLFFVPRSRHVEYSIFSYSVNSLELQEIQEIFQKKH